ncbi:hypothetical protein DL96DRAFT_1575342 [Flagelloscypha sp. PMI_526]|nr:hypothetical protein DL96DRAFT_1575342 [Flagelloscypha sp. PMI_526]
MSFSESVSVSVSPPTSTLHDRFRSGSLHPDTIRAPKVLHPVENEGLRLLLLENISQDAVKAFKAQGYHVDHHTKAWSEQELIDNLGSYHAIGIRSKTKITARVIEVAPKLLVIGCFCIGTNQVDLSAAAKAGIPVFNSPFSNSRSVAELVMGELVALSRQLVDRAFELRNGLWNKQSKGCWELRGKTLGIVGYGHIGSQLSVLAEAFGVRVLFYDVINIMPIGNSRQVETLTELLSNSDYVTLHVPELPETTNMISKKELISLGQALDVFPTEPGANGAPFDNQVNPWASTLCALPNDRPEEAQRMIGEEVSQSLSRYLDYGSTIGAVNFPEVDLRAILADQGDNIRVCHVHRNQPGVLREVNNILGPYNVEKQYSDSKGDIAYVMADIADVSPADIAKLRELISKTEANILTRMLA